MKNFSVHSEHSLLYKDFLIQSKKSSPANLETNAEFKNTEIIIAKNITRWV